MAPPLGPERNPAQEFAASRYAPESLSAELITRATNPVDFFYGLREMHRKLEDGNIPGSLSNDFRPPGILTSMFERAHNLHLTPAELIRRRWVESYDEESGIAVLTHRRYSAVALDMDQGEPHKLPDGRVVEVVFLGKPEVREILAATYDTGVLEFETRSIMGEQIGAMLNLNARDDLATLVDWEHGTNAKYKPDHLKALHNLPSIAELESTDITTSKEFREKRELGDQIEEAFFCNLIMLRSGSKQDMKDLLARPGAKFLISKMAAEEDARREAKYNALSESEKAAAGPYKRYTREDWEAEYIGDVDAWTDDMARDPEETWRQEREDRSGIYAGREFGKRGKLTKWANIPAFAGRPGEMSTDEENHFIEEDVGGACGSKEASWITTTQLRNIGAYASEGYVALPNGKSWLPLGEFRYISSDDRGKFYGYMFYFKEGTRGRSSGLRGMIGRMPDMAMNLYDWAQVAVPLTDEKGNVINGPDNKPIIVKRSIWDAWLGTAEQPKKDMVTGKVAEYGVTELDPGIHPEDIKKGLVLQVTIPAAPGAPSRMAYMYKEDAARIANGEFELVVATNPKIKQARAFYATKEDAKAIRDGEGMLMEETLLEDVVMDKVVLRKKGEKRQFYAKRVKAEGYNRLGSLKFDSLERDFSGTFGTMQWLMGRENIGVWADLLNVTKFSADDFELSELKKKIKYIGITQNLIVLTKGSPHLYDTGRITYEGVKSYDLSDIGAGTLTMPVIETTGTETIQRNLLRNQMAARIRSATYVKKIMPQTAKIYTRGRGGAIFKEVPVTGNIENDIKEAFNQKPKTEEELVQHYVDDVDTLGKEADVDQPLRLYNEAATWLTTDIGIVRGRRAKQTYVQLT